MDTSPAQLEGGSALGPSTVAERIVAMDVLRGFALLGILLLNIRSFANIEAVYLNPLAAGPLSRLELAIWYVSELLGEAKFMTLFSMLFGAGVVLMYERRRQAGLPIARIHYRRMLGLLLIGVVHAYLIWAGDILVTYALCGCVVFLFCRWRPRSVFALGVMLLLVGTGINLLFHVSIPHWTPEDRQYLQGMVAPSPAEIASDLRAHRGSWLEQLPVRAEASFFMQTFLLIIWSFWRVTGLMLIGMGLFKTGVFTGKAGRGVYMALLAAAVFVGLPMIALGLWWHPATARHDLQAFFIGSLPNYWGSVLLALGYAAIVMLICRTTVPGWLRPLSAVGRTALSNYLLQSVICTLIFSGHGLGLYGRVNWGGQLGIVGLIWVVQLAVSTVYLAHFRLGPVEAAWRSLTYGRWPGGGAGPMGCTSPGR